MNHKRFTINNDELGYYLAGLLEGDGHFDIKINDFKSKTINTKRSRSVSVTLKFVLQQRLLDKPTNNNFINIMTDIKNFLNCNLNYVGNNKMISL